MISQPPTTDTHQLTSAVIAVVLRVAGAVITDVLPHAIGTPERQVTTRIGDVLLYLTDRRTVARIRQQWDAAQYIAIKRLPETVSQTWLANPEPDTYPLGVSLRLEGAVQVTSRWMAGSSTMGTPPHLRVRVDRLVWQVCDLQAWTTIGDAWFEAQRHLEQ